LWISISSNAEETAEAVNATTIKGGKNHLHTGKRPEGNTQNTGVPKGLILNWLYK
jgi:hypothetical protein